MIEKILKNIQTNSYKECYINFMKNVMTKQNTSKVRINGKRQKKKS